MLKNKTKFKIGQKVRILPSAEVIGVLKSEVGKIVEIRDMFGSGDIRISDSRGDGHACWSVGSEDIAPVIEVGQQFLFDFME